MSNDTVMTVTVKGIGDFSDVVSNVGSVQKALTKLKLPDKLGDNLNKNITNFYKEYEKYQKKISEGIKTQGDYNQVEKSLNNMRNLYQAIGKDAQKLTELDMKDILNLDTGEFKKIMNEMTSVMKQIGSVKIDTSPFTKAFKDIQGITKNSKVIGENGLLNKIIGSINTGQIAEAKKQLQELQNYAKKVAPRTTIDGKQAPGTLSPEKYQQLTRAIDTMNGAVTKAETAINPLIEKHNNLQKELDETKQKAAQNIKNEFKGYNQASGEVEKLTDSLRRMHEEEFNFNREAQNIDRQIQSYFGLSQMIRKVGDIARDAFATVKELDKAMTQTAVVTNFNVGDMWDMLPTYTAQANQLGSTIKDVYEAATLYYQQGLNTNQAMGLANETLKMARIAGLDAADATNMMTAALRGFNMEINQMSAQKVNDIYSELAAITASDTAEIGSAMERTASIANSANMEFATTSAFLAQMIETTREAPENLGTAMKTIVARFQEMKQDPTKLIDSEGVAMDANKVDKALKTIGVDLMNTKGEFRDLDDVFLDISAKWDSLTQGQQRYIATIAAGSRQQSRFIAMMSNYERTMELVDAANNSAGASQRQFEKTLDSMEAKLNKLKNAWDQFTMGLMNNQILKFGVDALTEGFTIVNKFIDILGKIPPKPFEGITKSILTLVTTLGMLNFGKKASRGLVMGGAAWWKGEEGGFGKNFMSGFSGKAAKAGTTDGQVYIQNFNNAIKKSQLKEAFTLTQSRAKEIYANNNKTGEYANTFGAAFSQFPAEELSANWTPQIEAEIRSAFQRATANVDLTQYGIKDADEYLNGMISELSSGKSSAATEAKILSEMTDGKVDLNSTGVNQMSKSIDSLGNSLLKTGANLQTFGMALQDTPLAPFGALLSKVGMLVTGFGSTFAKVTTIFTNGMNMVVQSEITGSLATAGLAGGFKALWGALLESPLFPIVAALLALYGTYKLLDAAIISNKEQLETATDAAAAASEAYDSAKQETSELADSISTIKETDSAFDNLVAGTAEFNDQLITANEQIMALIDKYPMLMEQGYVSTDKNGLMHISEEGFKAVKEYQKQIQAQASAMNIIQTADLNALENQQKAKQLRNQIKSYTSEDDKNRMLRDADLLEQRADAEVKLARQNAIHTALSSKELNNTEALTAIYTDLYEQKRKAAEVDVNALNKHDIRQKYADYHGYTYDKSTKKIKDVEGNEIDYDDTAIKDEVIEQTVLLDFETNASSLEGILNKLDSAFSGVLDSSIEGANSFFTDVLSSNIETDTDLLEQVLDSPKELQNVVDKLSTEEVEAILGLTTGTVSEVNFDQYKNEVVDLFLERANNIVDAQSQSYEQLAIMLAKSKGWTTSETSNITGNKEMIQSMLKELTTQQATTLSTIGQTLEESVGSKAMSTFIRDASDIYLNKSKETAEEFDNIISDINWSSAASRLEGYHKAIQSTDKDIQKWGQDMRDSADEANILGEAFLEFGNDWEELSDKVDDFKNAAGQIDGAGILKVAESSKALKSLLDSDEVSATGVAMALQGIEDGKYAISEVDTTVLQLLSSLNRLADAAYEAHNIIEGFDAGIDTGEGEDFVIENAKKAKEYYDNGEVGNQQLQNYIKLAAGTERWNEALKENHGDIGAATDDLMKYVTTFSNGFEAAWDQMASGKGINGKSLVENINASDISDELKEKFKSVNTFWDDEGFLQVDFGELTTSELEQYYEAAYGVSKEYAKLLVQDLANYDATVSSMLAKNDLKEAVQSKSFQNEHMVNGQMILTDAQLDTFEAAGGSLDELAEAAGTTADALRENQFEVLKDGKRREDYTQLLQDYAKTFQTGKDRIDSLFDVESLKNKMGAFDLNKLIQDTQLKGFDSEQAMQTAWKAYQRAQQTGDTVSNGEIELKQGMTDYAEFVKEMNSALETDKWVTIGEAIAQGAMNFFNKQEQQQNPSDTSGITSKISEKPSTTTSSERDRASEEASRRGTLKAYEDVNKVFGAIGKWLTTPVNTDAARNQKTTGGYSTTKNNRQEEQTAKNLNSGAEALDKNSTDLTGAAKSLDQAANNLNQAATTLQAGAKTANSTNTQQQTTSTPAEISSPIQSGGDIVQNVVIKAIGGEEVQSQINDIKTKADSGANMQVKAGVDKTVGIAKSAVDSVQNAAKKKNVVNVTTTGINKVNQLGKSITGVKNKEVSVKANTSGLSAVQSLKNAISNLKSKTIDIVTNKITKNKGGGNSGASGINNGIPTRYLPQAHSLAKGTGKNGPRNRGGLTLTGELGYEIAWLPSEGRSVILGTTGPQMINLPRDAVVYDHDQSEDILKKRQTIEAGSMAKTRRKKSSSTSGGKGKSNKSKKGKKGKKGKKNKKNKEKEITPTINNWSIEEAVRFNIDQSLATITEEISLRTKEIEKNLNKIGTTYNDIVGSTEAQVAALNQVKQKNQELLESNQKQLNDYLTKQQYVSWTDANGESQRTLINIASYLNTDGSINTGALSGLSSNRALQEAVYQEISSAKSIVDGINKANQAIQNADEQIAELGKKISEAFYQWENELTEVYDLTQRINSETSFTDRFTSQIELELAKLGAGFGDTTESIQIMRNVLNRSNATIREQLINQQQMIYARRRELDLALDFADEVKKRQYFETKDGVDQAANIEYFKNLEEGAVLGYKYLKDVFKDLDGSLHFKIDWEQFNKDNETNPYTKDTYERIKNYLDTLSDASNELNNSIKDQTDFITQTYNALKEYQDYIVDFEDTLIDGTDALIEEQANNAKTISESITSALKDLLDEVKRKLDERRKQEDNAKTERDISQKQQRLAALRANTAGGNQVEIARLEQEIAEAQQSYGRTLEDQLIDSLSQQADAAAQQRERQIELAETSNAIAAANNKELVDMWLRDPVAYKEEIKKAWLEANGYDEKGEAGQYVLRNQFESDFAELVNAVSETDFQNNFKNLEDLENDLVSLLTDLTNGEIVSIDEFNKNELGVLQATTAANVESILTEVKRMNSAASMKAQGIDAETLKTAGYSAKDLLGDDINNPIYSVAELQQGGYKASELKQAGISDVGTLKNAGYNTKNLKEAEFDFVDLLNNYSLQEMAQAFSEVEFKQNNVNYSSAVQAFGSGDDNLRKLSAAGYTEAGVELQRRENERAAAAAAAAAHQAAVNAYYAKVASAASNNKMGGDEFKSVIAYANAAGVSMTQMGADLAATSGLTWKQVVRAAKKAGYSKATAESWWKGYSDKANKALKDWSSYKTGGLADYTGPAWLDGTPSKPELVLNAKDTANFIALKDVLSKAIGSTKSINNSYGGDNIFEININVDKIEKDYDVDRVADRVKKKILESSSYRNVTQVRNFR